MAHLVDKVGTETPLPLVAHLVDKVGTKTTPLVAHMVDKVGTENPPPHHDIGHSHYAIEIRIAFLFLNTTTIRVIDNL